MKGRWVIIECFSPLFKEAALSDPIADSLPKESPPPSICQMAYTTVTGLTARYREYYRQHVNMRDLC